MSRSTKNSKKTFADDTIDPRLLALDQAKDDQDVFARIFDDVAFVTPLLGLPEVPSFSTADVPQSLGSVLGAISSRIAKIESDYDDRSEKNERDLQDLGVRVKALEARLQPPKEKTAGATTPEEIMDQIRILHANQAKQSYRFNELLQVVGGRSTHP